MLCYDLLVRMLLRCYISGFLILEVHWAGAAGCQEMMQNAMLVLMVDKMYTNCCVSRGILPLRTP